ncbi:MAG TPA: ABC transporter substrate-binding protein [Ramlibacter sp.]|nr:ABC transporter substrate-binding protein [Ramlibacter sp.]
MKTSHWALATSLCLALGAIAPSTAQTPPSTPEKVFRYAFPIAETGMDPAQLSDLYSRIITANIFEALYGYDYLSRPARIRPVLADGMPEVSADFRTYTVKLKKGIIFADDPAFGGQKREITAKDVVYTYKRIYDPKNKSPTLSGMIDEKIIGLEDLNKRAKASGKFDYDSEVEGLKALDKYTVQFKLGDSRPRFLLTLADPGILGIVAREVVEKYGDAIMEHPVGSGPFMLSEWKRSSKITFVKNPNYREVYYDGTPTPGDKAAEAIAAKMKGKRMPMVDKVIVSIIDEPQPRWLSFLNGEHDLMERLPQNFANHAIPNNKLAPFLVKKGITMERVPLSDITMVYFNMEDPKIGGYTPDKVALRRALSLAYNSDEEVRLPRRSQAIVAHSFIMPNTNSFDPNFRSEMGTFDRAKAIALLDMFGYVDKNGDGWRDMPDGSPLVLDHNTLGTSDYRELDEILKKNYDAIGVKITFKIGKWPEQLKAARAGKQMMWAVGLSASSPDSGGVLERGYGKSFGQSNLARFANAKFDELYQKQSQMPDGPERDKVIREAERILIAYMPYKVRVHRIGTDLMQPWVTGYKRHPNAREFWQYIDIDTAKLPKK